MSVVVPTRDRPDHLERCLATVRRALAEGDELIVVDSASTDPRVGDVARRHGATVLRCDQPGTSRARNTGWRWARHQLILFVDDDVTVDTDWAAAMSSAMRDHPDAAFVTGRIEVPPDQIEKERPVAEKKDAEPAVLTRESASPIGHSASLGVRRTALERVGGFDEALGGGARFRAAEDADLFDRLFAEGLTGWYEPTSRAWHDQWRRRRDLVRLDWSYGTGSGARIVKLARSDRLRARQVAREVMWTNGVAMAARHLRDRYKFGALTSAANAGGAVAGMVRALRVKVTGGHFDLPGGR